MTEQLAPISDPDVRDPLPAEEPPAQAMSFAPDGSLLDDPRSPEVVSFDPLLDELPSQDAQETERAPSPSETQS